MWDNGSKDSNLPGALPHGLCLQRAGWVGGSPGLGAKGALSAGGDYPGTSLRAGDTSGQRAGCSSGRGLGRARRASRETHSGRGTVPHRARPREPTTVQSIASPSSTTFTNTHRSARETTEPHPAERDSYYYRIEITRAATPHPERASFLWVGVKLITSL